MSDIVREELPPPGGGGGNAPVYKEDPYQHIIGIRLNSFRFIHVYPLSRMVGIGIGGIAFDRFGADEAWHLFDVSPPPSAVFASAADSGDVGSVNIDLWDYYDAYPWDGGVAINFLIGWTFVSGEGHEGFGGTIMTFNSNGLLTSTTNPRTLVTTTYDPPL
jgi:hypothetical protein